MKKKELFELSLVAYDNGENVRIEMTCKKDGQVGDLSLLDDEYIYNVVVVLQQSAGEMARRYLERLLMAGKIDEKTYKRAAGYETDGATS